MLNRLEMRRKGRKEDERKARIKSLYPNKKIMAWSDKYKKSIDCGDNPKGFSQKAHCAGRRKKAK